MRHRSPHSTHRSRTLVHLYSQYSVYSNTHHPFTNTHSPSLAMDTALPSRVTRDINGSFPFPVFRYAPRHEIWPYTQEDFERVNEDPDSLFWSTPNYHTILHPETIQRLRVYYGYLLPRAGSILDLCAGPRSYYPYAIETSVWSKTLEVVGVGMNLEELRVNSVLQAESSRKVHNLNEDHNVYHAVGARQFNAATCVLSIMYLTSPCQMLESLRSCMVGGGRVHIVVNNICRKDKTIKKWNTVGARERLQMVRGKLYSLLLH